MIQNQLLKKTLFLFCGFFLYGMSQAQTIAGKVTGENGNPLSGVSVQIKNSNKGTGTDANGTFQINANPGKVLVFTFVGYEPQEVKVDSKIQYDVSLSPKANQLNSVVVTALDIKRSEKSLSYASQQVSGEQVSAVKTDNLMNALS